MKNSSNDRNPAFDRIEDKASDVDNTATGALYREEGIELLTLQ